MFDCCVVNPQANEPVIAKLDRIERHAIRAIEKLNPAESTYRVHRMCVCMFATMRAAVRDERVSRMLYEMNLDERG